MTDKPKRDLVQPFRDLKSKWHFKHIAYRDILDWDAERQRLILDRKTIEQSEVEPIDLLVDGEKWKVFRTPLELPTVPDTRVEVDEDGVEHTYLNPTPISYNLYNESDVLNQASTGEFRTKIINPLTLAIILGVGFVFLLLMVL